MKKMIKTSGFVIGVWLSVVITLGKYSLAFAIGVTLMWLLGGLTEYLFNS